MIWNGVSVGTYDPTSGLMQTIALDVTAIDGNNTLMFREIGESGDNTGTFLANVKVGDIIVIDETAGVDTDSDDTTNPTVQALFNGIVNVGTDPDMPLHAICARQRRGGECRGPVRRRRTGSERSLSLCADACRQYGRGFRPEDHGRSRDTLFNEGGLIVGRIDNADGTANPAGAAALALHIDAGTGQVAVAQFVSLQHPDTTTNDEGISLAAGSVSVTVTATDGDGDHVSQSADISQTVVFEDDTPVIVTPDQATVVESTAAGSSNTFAPASATGSLGISWGADNANPDSGTHDRSVAFDPALAGVQGLTSNGDAITYTLSSNNTVLTATTTHGSVTHTVFTVSVNDQTGNYSFNLFDNIDHTPPASGADHNDSALSFGFTATDSDGDSTSSSFTVHVTDDIPVVTGLANTGNVSESALPSVQSTFGNLNIDWNADDRGTSHLEFAPDSGGHLMPAGLTSGGVPLDYTVRLAANGVDQELVAFKQGDTDANPVFIVALNGLGNPAFAFTLWQPLDHTGGNDASLPLGFTVKAVDGDGNSVTQTFTVNIVDDVPNAVNDTNSISEDAPRRSAAMC